MTERLYIVDKAPQGSTDRLMLTDGRAVICRVENEALAQALTAKSKALGIRQHSDLSRTDQQKVLKAM